MPIEDGGSKTPSANSTAETQPTELSSDSTEPAPADTIAVQDQNSSDLPTPQRKAGDFGNVPVSLTIIGNAQWVNQRNPVRTTPGKQASVDTTFTNTDEHGVAKMTLKITGPGPIAVIATTGGFDRFGPGVLSDPSAIFINAQGGQCEVAKLILAPIKAYRHISDPVTVKAGVLDRSGNPVPYAKVVFSAIGDCEPTVSQVAKVTDALGVASITVVPRKPGVATVVAAGVDANGIPVMASDASHIFYFDDHHHTDEMERGFDRR